MPEDHSRVALGGAVVAVVAAAACCALPVIVASGALATFGAWLLNPVVGAFVGIAALVVVAAVIRARRPCDTAEARARTTKNGA